MSTNDTTNLTPEILAALRQEPDAVRVIAERLQVKQMGPADHIRTKHEIKAFVELGGISVATDLLRRADQRHRAILSVAENQMQGQRRSLTD